MSEFQELQSWIQSLLSFKVKSKQALNEEERLSTEEEKQLFLEEIGVGEESLMNIFTNAVAFYQRYDCASTDEERESIRKEICHFLKGVEDFKAAVDKNNLEKKQNSIPPSA